MICGTRIGMVSVLRKPTLMTELIYGLLILDTLEVYLINGMRSGLMPVMGILDLASGLYKDGQAVKIVKISFNNR